MRGPSCAIPVDQGFRFYNNFRRSRKHLERNKDIKVEDQEAIENPCDASHEDAPRV
jgi:hypothetical protein